MVGDTILIKDISINGNSNLDTASELSETLTNKTINALGIDASSRTIWVNGQPYGNAYVNVNGDTVEAPIGAEIFNDFEHNTASGAYSHAEGKGTITTNEAEHAEGQYNKSNKGSTTASNTIHSVGIGSSNNDRQNALEIMQNGDAYMIGIGGYDGKNLNSATRLQDAVSNAINITWSDLKALRDNEKLVPGKQYRITDYVCTTKQEGTKAKDNKFDIIVTADSPNTLNEEARASLHEKDAYFSNCDLNAWQIWYCLDNDTTRFAWADRVNGKGVIYRMIDEFNNDVPYDFKNIQFKDPNSTDTNYFYYTFSGYGEDETDYSILRTTNIFSNTISPFYGSDLTNSAIQTINKILFSVGGDGNCYGNYFGSGCYNITLAFYCYNNTFGNGCYSNSLNPYCSNNTFGDDCHSNTLNLRCSYNIFEYKCYSNTLGEECRNNTLGNSCFSNSLDNRCNDNSFGGGCYSNHLGNGCNYNSFGNGCYSNSLGGNCYSNSFGERCYSNSFRTACNSNSFGNACNSNSFDNDCYYNSFGNYCSSNSLGINCLFNSFGNGCSYIKFASDSSASNKYNYYRHNHFGDGCLYIIFTGAETASSSTQVQKYNFAQGLKGTSDAYLTVNGVRNREYETKVAKNSKGELKIYCEADSIQ